jgi:peptidoglycan/LPS O-acetylase OafA/YrhL
MRLNHLDPWCSMPPPIRRSHKHGRYLTLDGLRGAAAISVMLFHRRWLFPGGHFLDHSFLAVDFFFGLSGFVVAYAYEEKLLKGMNLLEFVKVRVIRLYPLIVVGGLLGGARWLLRAGDRIPILLATLCAMLGLPTPVPVSLSENSHLLPFPINNPGWSLFFELLVNIGFAAAARLLGLRVLIAVILVSLAWLLASAVPLDSIARLGVYYDSFFGGIPRTSVSFFIGVLIYHLHRLGLLPEIRMPVWPLLLALMLTFAPNWTEGRVELLYELFCILVVFPLIIMAGCQNQPNSMGWAASLGGTLSYPIYLLHYPIYSWIEALHFSPQLSLIVSIIAAPIISYLALGLYDNPIRHWLSKKADKSQQSNATIDRKNEVAPLETIDQE